MPTRALIECYMFLLGFLQAPAISTTKGETRQLLLQMESMATNSQIVADIFQPLIGFLKVEILILFVKA